MKRLIKNLKHYFFIYSIIVVSTPAFAQQKSYKNKTVSRDYEGIGLAIKLVPAFYWNSLGLELEQTLSQHFTVGLNIYGKLGSSGQSRLSDEEFHKSGYLAEASLKYYFNTSPSGLYLQAHAGASNMIFADGTYRPFSVNSNTKNWEGTNTKATFANPKPIFGGLGLGYQFIIVPGQLVGNMLSGLQANFTEADKTNLSFFFTPSIGFIF